MKYREMRRRRLDAIVSVTVPAEKKMQQENVKELKISIEIRNLS